MNKRGGVEEGECSVIVGADGGEEWGETIEEVCEQEGDGGEGGGLEGGSVV